MKKFVVILVMLFGMSSCTQIMELPVDATQSLTPNQPAASSTPVPVTATPEPTGTATPLPTHTPTASLTPSKTPDITSLGNPSTPTVEHPSTLPNGFFTYNADDQYVYERMLHGRPVTVVFEKSTLFSEAERTELTDYIFDTWLYFWDVFGGYRTQQLLIRFGDQPNPEGETSVGFRCQEQYIIDDKNGAPESDWFQPLAHGIFHAWHGGTTIIGKTCAEKWFDEGATQYYGDRQATRVRYMFDTNQYLLYYQQLIGTSKDISLVDGGVRYCRSNTRDRLFYYRKGALVMYLMDIEINKQGHSLDELMKLMYEQYGLTGKPYTTDDVKIALESITSNSWEQFFKDYIYGTVPLPIEHVEYLER